MPGYGPGGGGGGGGGVDGPVLELTLTGDVAVSSGTTITNFTVVEDSAGDWAAGVYTVSLAGIYDISFQFRATAAGGRSSAIKITRAGPAASTYLGTFGSGSPTSSLCNVVARLEIGDTVEYTINGAAGTADAAGAGGPLTYASLYRTML